CRTQACPGQGSRHVTIHVGVRRCRTPSNFVRRANGYGTPCARPTRGSALQQWTAKRSVRRTAGNGQLSIRYAVSTLAVLSRPNSLIETSRILNFWILPVMVIGNESTNRTYRGILKFEILPLQKSLISWSESSAPSFNFTQATTSSPYLWSGTPITCTS